MFASFVVVNFGLFMFIHSICLLVDLSEVVGVCFHVCVFMFARYTLVAVFVF